MEALGGFLSLVVIVFLIVLAILWLILPFAVFKIRDQQKQTAQSIEAIEAALGEMSDNIARQTEILDTEHKIKMIRQKTGASG